MVTLILTIDIMMMKIYFQAPMDLIMKERSGGSYGEMY